MLDDAVIAVVVPAFDEESWLGEVLDTMPRFVDRVVVVDDGSRDGTARLVRARQHRGACGVAAPGAVEPGSGRGPSATAELALVRHRENRGVGAAIVTGYRHALALGADVVAVMAGDGQMHPSDLVAVVRPVAAAEADYVKGTRLGHPGLWRVMPAERLLGSWVLSWLTSLAAGVRVSDSQCGYTAMSARALAKLPLERLWPGFGYPNDLIGACALAGLRIAEVPVRPVYRGQKSGLRPWHAAVIAALIARVGYRRLTAAACRTGRAVRPAR